MEEKKENNKFLNKLIFFSFAISIGVFIFNLILFLPQPNLQPIDMDHWINEKSHNYYYQNDIIYYNKIIDITKATLSIYYPKQLLDCRDEYKFFKCVKNHGDDVTIAMFLLNTDTHINKNMIDLFMNLSIIIVKPHFHDPFDDYDIILSITEIKAAIKYTLSNFKDSKLYVIGYGIYGEICNVLAMSQNYEDFKDLLNNLETETADEKIEGVISVFPKGGFDIQNSAFEWLIGKKRYFSDFDIAFYKIHYSLVQNYNVYLKSIFNESDFKCLENDEINKYETILTKKYKNCLNFFYEVNKLDRDFSFETFPIIDGIFDRKKKENKLFGNYDKETPQHFDFYLSNFINETNLNVEFDDFSAKNNYGNNLNISYRVNLSTPMFYMEKFLLKNDDETLKNWTIYSNKSFINSEKPYFPTEFNLYLKLYNKSYFHFNVLEQNFDDEKMIYSLSYKFFNESKNS